MSFDIAAPADAAGTPNAQPRAARRYDPSLHGDRRSRPTPALSRYSFFGGRRQSRDPNSYTDRYSYIALIIMLAMTALNLCDSFFTLVYLQRGGAEANPIADWMLRQGPSAFLMMKTLFFGVASGVLCLHKNFGRARVGIWLAMCAYVFLLLYHMFLFFRRDIGLEL